MLSIASLYSEHGFHNGLNAQILEHNCMPMKLHAVTSTCS